MCSKEQMRSACSESLRCKAIWPIGTRSVFLRWLQPGSGIGPTYSGWLEIQLDHRRDTVSRPCTGKYVARDVQLTRKNQGNNCINEVNHRSYWPPPDQELATGVRIEAGPSGDEINGAHKSKEFFRRSDRLSGDMHHARREETGLNDSFDSPASGTVRASHRVANGSFGRY